ncbi:GNAT family N-acetyltransferase [Actinoplanes sp. NEAU-A11]|uniref:GNAT family N-acetyltransferase n=1 Tax=Actinoplanes aureus TaxID=2792083 RepID=A0A931G2A6_9ACTN|nr:GNAT family N-acetyltransferase [Actinoplanes aureus]
MRLREYRPADAAAFTEGYEDPVFRRFSRPDTGPPAPTGHVIADERTDEVLGGIGLNAASPGRRQAEVTFWVGPWARRRGVATAALRAFDQYAFGSGLERLELLIHWDNPAAQRVAMAAGYTREGVRRGALPSASGGRDDMLVYTRLAGDPQEPATRLLPDLPGGELTDGVVTLRPLAESDVDFYTELHTLADVIATSVPPVPMPADEIRQRCFRAEAQWLAGTRADLIITDAATGAQAGEIGLYYQEPPLAQAMIGYSMLPAYRGRGLTTRAAQLVALWAFAETDIVRLIAGALPTNVGSKRVLEKAGFRQEAYQRSRLPGPDGTRVDDVQYVLLAGDLLAQASSTG